MCIWLIKNSTVASILVRILWKLFFLTLTTKFWQLLWLSFCTHPHLGSSFTGYHLYASALFISLKSIKYSLLEYKSYIDIYSHKCLTKLKKRNFHLLTNTWLLGVWNLKWEYLSNSKIWACLWNRHNWMYLILSFQLSLFRGIFHHLLRSFRLSFFSSVFLFIFSLVLLLLLLLFHSSCSCWTDMLMS